MRSSRRFLLVVSLAFEMMAVEGLGDTRKIYWVRGPSSIWRANLNGSQKESVLSGLYALLDLEVDTTGGKVYWSSIEKIQRANLDGSGLEDLLPFGTDGLAIDEIGGKLYWVRQSTIQRANVDGTNVEVVVANIPVPDCAAPFGLALDLVNNQVYWPDSTFVCRANLDGSSVEAVIEDPDWGVHSVAIDGAGGKIYWVASSIPPPGGVPGDVRRCNLDGSGLETLVNINQPVTPERIALDVEGGHVYWAQEFEIRRANLDGSNNVSLGATFDTRGIGLFLPCCPPFGDIMPANRTPADPCVVDVDDITCVLLDFVIPGTCSGADLYPCGGDGIIDVDDILVELDAFIGDALCETACP